MPNSVKQELMRCAAARAWLSSEAGQTPAEPSTHAVPPVVMRVSAHPSADAYVVREVFDPSFSALRRMSRGRLVAEGHWGESAHPAAEGFEALADGRTDLAPCYTNWRADDYPMAQLLALPGLFPNSEIGTEVAERLYAKYLRTEFERPGLLMGRLKATGAYHLFSHKPVRRLADLRGMSIAVNAGLDSRIATALDATPVALSSVELLPAFLAGRVDAVSLADGSADVFGVGAKAPYRIEMGVSMMNMEFGLSAAFLQRLEPGLQAILNDWLRAEAQAETQILYGLGGALARERFAAAGCAFLELPTHERMALDERMADLADRTTRELDRRSLPASRFVAEARELARGLAGKDANQLMRDAIERPLRLLSPAD
ncbi:TRAP transporter substrate-binding protein DctP [Pigmentiphaga sp. YJ18]|uniref:TRAP transporter substrate-binding protein DctP n=1 Tax=Pigmentiphaga sp. YJ18 TaxID=3134907 RepID=UPI00310E6BB9